MGLEAESRAREVVVVVVVLVMMGAGAVATQRMADRRWGRGLDAETISKFLRRSAARWDFGCNWLCPAIDFGTSSSAPCLMCTRMP